MSAESPPPPPAPTPPPQPEFKSEQYEFSDEQNRNIAALAQSMFTVATMMKVLGLAFVIFGGLQLATALRDKGNYAPAIGISVAALLFLVIGFWTSGSARSFSKIVETRNEDMWHLMNALRRLYNMYSLMRTIIIGGLVVAVVGLALTLWNLYQEAPLPE
jgi:hypothetical protein